MTSVRRCSNRMMSYFVIKEATYIAVYSLYLEAYNAVYTSHLETYNNAYFWRQIAHYEEHMMVIMGECNSAFIYFIEAYKRCKIEPKVYKGRITYHRQQS